MKKILRKIVPKNVIEFIRVKKIKIHTKKLAKLDSKRFMNHSFIMQHNVKSFEQYEAKITKLYHSIEKGLSYEETRLGFGKEVLDNLLLLMNGYKSCGFPLDTEFYSTALSNLYKYIELHEKKGYDVEHLKQQVKNLNGRSNDLGGTYDLRIKEVLENLNCDFEKFSMSRHSVRDFSDKPVDIELVKKAIHLAQNTPSACNRQGWKIRVIADDSVKRVMEKNQNGNRGFGHLIDKYLLITTDSRYFAMPRERNQPYIDGGMYAMNLLYSLHYNGIATIPLSASLTYEQEKNIRRALKLEESENLILFIGIGNYLESCKIPKSTRKTPEITII
jgi:nitroreductase